MSASLLSITKVSSMSSARLHRTERSACSLSTPRSLSESCDSVRLCCAFSNAPLSVGFRLATCRSTASESAAPTSGLCTVSVLLAVDEPGTTVGGGRLTALECTCPCKRMSVFHESSPVDAGLGGSGSTHSKSWRLGSGVAGLTDFLLWRALDCDLDRDLKLDNLSLRNRSMAPCP
jgi:hypothetical protein